MANESSATPLVQCILRSISTGEEGGARDRIRPTYPTGYLICAESSRYDVEEMNSLTLEINGEMRTVSPVTNVRDLMKVLGIGEERVAVEVNRRIVRRVEWEITPLSDRDRVEIVRFVGGG